MRNRSESEAPVMTLEEIDQQGRRACRGHRRSLWYKWFHRNRTRAQAEALVGLRFQEAATRGCPVCLKPFRYWIDPKSGRIRSNLTLDIVAHRVDGEWEFDNPEGFIVACGSCNFSRGDKPLDEYVAWLTGNS